MKPLRDVLRFHGHMCPGLALGWRVSGYVLREFCTKRAQDEELVAIVENDSCAVDAIQAMTGCTFGKGNLIFRDWGKQVYTFIKRPTGAAIRISVDWKSPEETPEEKKNWQRYSRGDRSKEVLRAVHRRRSKKIKSVLGATDEELFKVMRMKMKLPPEAHIYGSLTCQSCGEKVMEPLARLRDGKILCIPCFGG